MKTARLLVSLSLSLITFTSLAACVDSVDTGDQIAAASSGDPPRVCDPYEPPPPEPIAGPCVYEVSLESVSAVRGQGASESAMEINVRATSNGSGVSWPGAMPATAEFIPGPATPVGSDGQITEYVVPAGTRQKITLCANFTEVDNGGLNGADDTGRACVGYWLEAQALPGGGTVCPSNGHPSVSTDLCGPNQCNGRMSATFEVLQRDADGDGVENPEDVTPLPCDEELKGQLGRASLVWFFFGDGKMTTFVQSVGTDLSPSMTGYDFKVVLIDPAFVGPFLLNAQVLKDADMILSPTEENLYVAIREITRRGYDMDISIHSHGAPGHGSEFESLDMGECNQQPGNEHCWNGVDDDGDGIVDEADGVWGDELVQNLAPGRIGTDLLPIRMVYSIACYGAGMNASWQQVGAKVTSGTRGINFYPRFYGAFTNTWNTGSTYAGSVVASDTPVERALCESFVAVDGDLSFDCDDVDLENPDEETLSVLDLNACARDYFVDDDPSDPNPDLDQSGYDIGVGVYDVNRSGWSNMQSESTRLTAGDSAIRKHVPATLTW